MTIRRPTPDECNANAVVYGTDDAIGYALWHPQVGGYCGRAVAIMSKRWWRHPDGAACGACFDLAVWHDGDFPRDSVEPVATLHFCGADQFVRFGQEVAALQAKHRVPAPENRA